MNPIKKTFVIGSASLAIAMSAIVPAFAASTASLRLTSPIAADVQTGTTQYVHWTSSRNAPSTVSVNLIQKVSDNPATYQLVRTIVPNTKNDGTAVWIPTTSDIGTGLSLEVACTPTARACSAGDSSASGLAVIDNGMNSNTAAIYQAIEQWYNNK